MASRLSISEIFGPTIQGEGLTSGRPVHFLRLAFCNLSCKFCDTPFTWNFEETPNKTHGFAKKVCMKDEVFILPIEAVFSQLEQKAKETNIYHLVISGGEPILQKEALCELLTLLKTSNKRWYFEIETNGSLKPSGELFSLVNHFNVSPKLKNSGNDYSIAVNIDILAEFNLMNNAVFKFVVATEEDLEEVLPIIDKCRIPNDKVFLMPLGHNQEILLSNREKVIQMCIKNGFTYSPRIQVEVWGEKRKV